MRILGEAWYRLVAEAKNETPNIRKDHQEPARKKTNRRRRRNLLNSSTSRLFPLLRRTAHPPLSIDTPKRSISAPPTRVRPATLHLPKLAVLARLRNAAAGNKAGRLNVIPMRVGELVTLVAVVWNLHGNGHGCRHESRHRHGVDLLVLREVVDLKMERAVDWDARGWDRLLETTINGLWNRDRSGGDRWTVELPNLQDQTTRGKNADELAYLRTVQLARRLIG